MMNVKVKIYDQVKYNKESEKVTEVEFKNIKGFEVVTGEKATKISEEIGDETIDPYNEYLVITLEDDSTATFNNSEVDLFRI